MPCPVWDFPFGLVIIRQNLAVIRWCIRTLTTPHQPCLLSILTQGPLPPIPLHPPRLTDAHVLMCLCPNSSMWFVYIRRHVIQVVKIEESRVRSVCLGEKDEVTNTREELIMSTRQRELSHLDQIERWERIQRFWFSPQNRRPLDKR